MWSDQLYWYHTNTDDNKMSYKYIFPITKIKWTSWTHAAPYITKQIKRVAEGTNYILEFWQNIPNKNLLTPLNVSPHVINGCEQSCIMMIMRERESSMLKTEFDLKDIIYPSYGTHHRLRSISGNKTQCQSTLPLLVWLKWGTEDHLSSVGHWFSGEGGWREVRCLCHGAPTVS